jgi:hypothetical protein
MATYKLAQEYCSHMSTLVSLLEKSIKKNPSVSLSISVLPDKIRIAMNGSPQAFAEHTGVYLYKYRTEITSSNIGKLANVDLSKEIPSDTESSDRDEAREIISVIQHLWSTASKKEQELVSWLVKEMLSIYANILLKK